METVSSATLRKGPEIVVVAVYAALVALPFAALIPMIPTVGVSIAVGLTAALCWRLLVRGGERVTLLRGAAIGALVGATFHMVFSMAYGLYAFLTGSADDGFLDAMGGGLKMGIVTTVFGSVISIPVGILAFVLYVGLVRPRLFPV